MKEGKPIDLHGWQTYEVEVCEITFSMNGSVLQRWTKSPSYKVMRQSQLVTRIHIKKISGQRQGDAKNAETVETIVRVKSYYFFGSTFPHIQEWKIIGDIEGSLQTVVRKEGTWYQLEGAESQVVFLPDACKKKRKVERLDMRIFSDSMRQTILTNIPVYG